MNGRANIMPHHKSSLIHVILGHGVAYHPDHMGWAISSNLHI
jgi:hypothetical protein